MISSPATGSTATPRRRPRRLRRVLLTLAGLLLALLLLAGVAVWRYGPNFGVYLFPPSPRAYADIALQQMDKGYYAHGPAWQQARARAVAQTRYAKDYAGTIPALQAAVAVAGGHHSSLVPAEKVATGSAAEHPLPTLDTADGVTTIVLPHQRAAEPDFKQRYADTLANGIQDARTATTCGWIVDVRHNHGGDMNPMLAGLASLLPQGRLAANRRADGSEQWIELSGASVTVAGKKTMATTDHGHLDQPVAVLQGPDDGSAGEVVVLALAQQDHVRSFGGPTAGYSSANQVLRLYDGAQLTITTGVLTDRNGRSTDGGPIPPEQATDVATADRTARAWLAQQCR